MYKKLIKECRYFLLLLMLPSCVQLKNKEELKSTEVIESKKTEEQVKVIKEESTDDLVKFPKLKLSRSHLSQFKNLNKTAPAKNINNNKPFYEYYLKNKKQGEMLDVTNDSQATFDAISIINFVDAFSKVLEFNYIVDPTLNSTVTISIEAQMSRRDLWKAFEQVLWLGGAYCSLEGDILHILPFKKMPQERELFKNENPRANVEVALIQIKNASSKDISTYIKEFLTPGALAIDITSQNALLIVEAPPNMKKIRQLILTLDKKNRDNWPHRIFPCINMSATRLTSELKYILPILGFAVTSGESKMEPGSVHMTSLDRLQIIVASAANEEALDEITRWLTILDNDDIGEQEQLFIYNVKNGKAEELNQALSVLFSTSGNTLSAPTGGTSSTGSSTGSSMSKSSPSSSSSRKSSSNSQEGPASVFETPVTIFADGVHNRLLIKTTARAYSRIKALLESIDTAVSQVLLQIMVSEITLSEDTEYGTEFGYSTSGDGGNKSSVNYYDTLYKTNYSALSSTDANALGGSYLLSEPGNSNRFAYIRALAGEGKATVLSSPQIVVENNSEALVSVGDKVPIVTSENSDTSSGTTTNREIQYEETGTILTITPQITTSGLIKIKLKQEVSSAVSNTSSGIDSPIIQKRTLQTQLSLGDGKTVIVGGLISKKDTVIRNGLPFIKDLPLIGHLLSYNYIDSSRTELIILITGKIITNKTKQEKLMERFRNAVQEIKNLEELNKKPMKK